MFRQIIRVATPEEIAEMVAHLSKASFDRRELPVPGGKRIDGVLEQGFPYRDGFASVTELGGM